MINQFLEKQRNNRVKLTEEAKNLAIETFNLFKSDKENRVSEENFVNHWSGIQARMSATEYFSCIDTDGDCFFTQDRFLEFWRQSKEQGMSDDEIIVQLEMTR